MAKLLTVEPFRGERPFRFDPTRTTRLTLPDDNDGAMDPRIGWVGRSLFDWGGGWRLLTGRYSPKAVAAGRKAYESAVAEGDIHATTFPRCPPGAVQGVFIRRAHAADLAARAGGAHAADPLDGLPVVELPPDLEAACETQVIDPRQPPPLVHRVMPWPSIFAYYKTPCGPAENLELGWSERYILRESHDDDIGRPGRGGMDLYVGGDRWAWLVKGVAAGCPLLVPERPRGVTTYRFVRSEWVPRLLAAAGAKRPCYRDPAVIDPDAPPVTPGARSVTATDRPAPLPRREPEIVAPPAARPVSPTPREQNRVRVARPGSLLHVVPLGACSSRRMPKPFRFDPTRTSRRVLPDRPLNDASGCVSSVFRGGPLASWTGRSLFKWGGGWWLLVGDGDGAELPGGRRQSRPAGTMFGTFMEPSEAAAVAAEVSGGRAAGPDDSLPLVDLPPELAAADLTPILDPAAPPPRWHREHPVRGVLARPVGRYRRWGRHFKSGRLTASRTPREWAGRSLYFNQSVRVGEGWGDRWILRRERGIRIGKNPPPYCFDGPMGRREPTDLYREDDGRWVLVRGLSAGLDRPAEPLSPGHESGDELATETEAREVTERWARRLLAAAGDPPPRYPCDPGEGTDSWVDEVENEGLQWRPDIVDPDAPPVAPAAEYVPAEAPAPPAEPDMPTAEPAMVADGDGGRRLAFPKLDGMPREEAVRRALILAERDPGGFFKKPSARGWAERIGCSDSTVRKLDLYRLAAEEAGVELGRRVRKPRTVALTDRAAATVADRNAADPAEVAAAQEAELNRLKREQAADRKHGHIIRAGR